MRPLSKSEKPGCICIEPSIRKGTRWSFSTRPTRDTEVAKRFLLKALQSSARSVSESLTYEMETVSSQPLILSNGSSNQGWASSHLKQQSEPASEYEVMNLLRKGQVRGVNKGNIRKQITFIAHLFGGAA